MKKINSFLQGFVDDKNHVFKHKVGSYVASSLSGFIAGVVFASIVWLAVIFLLIANK